MSKKRLSPWAATAAAIRKELKMVYPDVKFSVTSEAYSMGNSVSIRWTDGPMSHDVDQIVKKYEYGSFDSMRDLYEYDNMRNDIPQAKYVQTSRNLSDGRRAEIAEQIGKLYHVDMSDDQAVFAMFNSWPSQVVYRFEGKLQEVTA